MKRVLIVLLILVPSIAFASPVYTATSKPDYSTAEASVDAVLDLSSFNHVDIGFYADGTSTEPLGEIPLTLALDENGLPYASANAQIRIRVKSGASYDVMLQANKSNGSQIDYQAVVTTGPEKTVSSGKTDNPDQDYKAVEIATSKYGKNNWLSVDLPLLVETVGLENEDQKGGVLEEYLTVRFTIVDGEAGE